MSELLAQYWWLLVFALLLGVVVAWWVFAINDKTRVTTIRSQDVLDEGAAPAQRNQALIDAPPAAVKNAAEAAVIAEPVAAPASGAGGDDLTRIKGLGPKLASLLASLGVTSFAQIADWSEDDIDRIDAQLGNFAGRIRRDNWPEQARLLASGDTSAYEAKFGKL